MHIEFEFSPSPADMALEAIRGWSGVLDSLEKLIGMRGVALKPKIARNVVGEVKKRGMRQGSDT